MNGSHTLSQMHPFVPSFSPMPLTIPSGVHCIEAKSLYLWMENELFVSNHTRQILKRALRAATTK
jgi:hypothetical protein